MCIFFIIKYGRPVRHRGSQIHVNYPAELDDEDIGTGLPAAGAVAQDCPLHGWDRTTDLYRQCSPLPVSAGPLTLYFQEFWNSL